MCVLQKNCARTDANGIKGHVIVNKSFKWKP